MRLKFLYTFRAENIVLCAPCMKFKLQKETEPSHSKQKLCQLWWGSLFKSCDHIQIPLYQRASWCHLWPNNVKQHSFFGRCQTATSSSGHVGWVTLLWTSHRAEQRASLKKKQTWIEKPQLFVFFVCFFLVYEISAAFFWNWQREMLTPRLSIPAGLERALLVPAWLCVTDLRGCNINQALRALRKVFESVAT